MLAKCTNTVTQNFTNKNIAECGKYYKVRWLYSDSITFFTKDNIEFSSYRTNFKILPDTNISKILYDS